MNAVVRGLLIGLLGAAASAAAAVPLITVTVADSSGKVAYKGITDAKGTFETGKLHAGSYVVYFNSKSAPKGGRYALVISAGKKKVIANAVEADKFSAGGVAMRIDVAAALNITGQVGAKERAQASSSLDERNTRELQLLRMAHQLEAAQSRSQ